MMKYLIFLFTFLTINLTAEELVVISLSELKANQHKYSGKKIVTQGKLYWSSSILNARTKIYLKEDNKFGKTFLLQLNPLEFKSEQLKKGNLVNIKAQVYGNSVILRRCEFVQVDLIEAGGAVTPEKKFDDFYLELDNFHKLRGDYKNKTLNITGYYPFRTSSSYYTYSSSNSDYIYLRAGGSYIYMYFDKNDLPLLDTLEEGDKVNIRASISDNDKRINASNLKVIEKFRDRKGLKVDIGRVVDAYKKDMIKADEKYKNQKFSFRDEIYDMGLEEDGTARVTIRRSFEYIYCHFSKKEAQNLRKYKKGKTIRLEGFHRGGDLKYLYSCRVK